VRAVASDQPARWVRAHASGPRGAGRNGRGNLNDLADRLSLSLSVLADNGPRPLPSRGGSGNAFKIRFRRVHLWPLRAGYDAGLRRRGILTRSGIGMAGNKFSATGRSG